MDMNIYDLFWYANIMISLKEMSFTYPGLEASFIDRVNLELGSGIICGLLGPNGAGKSTLFKLLSGLLKPQNGSCKVLGSSPFQRNPEFLSDLFILPEEVFVPALSLNNYVKIYARFYPKYDDSVFRTLIGEFGIDHNKQLTTLSLGQKKKFMLSFGIAANTTLLIMDEPASGLDIPSRKQLKNILARHHSESRSFIISSHQVGDIEGLINSAIIILSGTILLNIGMEEVIRKLEFSVEQNVPDDCLYAEATSNGYSVVRKNNADKECRLDLGLLYGFVTTEPDKARLALLGGQSG